MPTPPIPSAQSDWSSAISDLPMADYQADDSGNPTGLIKFVNKSPQPPEYTNTEMDNDGAETGSDWSTEFWNDKHDVNLPFDIDPTMTMLCRILTAFMGIPVTTSPETGVTKKVFNPQDASNRQLPAYWFAKRVAGLHDGLYPSCVGEKATFSGDDSGRLNVKGNFRNSGRQILGANIPVTPETGKYYLKNNGAKIVRAAVATPTTPIETTGCGLQSWSLDIDNGNSQSVGYDPGCGRYFTANDDESGMIRSFHPFGKRVYTGQYNIWMPATGPYLTRLQNKAPMALKLGNYGKSIGTTLKVALEFLLHLTNYSAVALGQQKEGFNLMQISFKARYNELTNKILTTEVTMPTPA